MGFWEFLWVLIVTCIVVFLIRWGTRTDRYRLAGFAIALGALFWAWLRPDSGGWFLFRPLEGAGWYFIIWVLLIASLVVGFFMWRLAKLIGWVAVFIAVLAPFWDLFTPGFWSDFQFWDWFNDWPGTEWMWLLALLAVVVGLLLLLFGVTLIGIVLVIVGLLLAAFTLVSAGVSAISGDDSSFKRDVCLKIDNIDDGFVQKRMPPGMSDVDKDRYCLTDKTAENDSNEENPVSGPEFTCASHLEQRPISDEERRRFIRDGIDSSTTEKSWEKLGNQLIHDASSLRQMAIYIGVTDVPPLSELLTDNGECLSEQGVELWDDTMNIGRGMLDSRFGFAPLDGHNSWIDRHGHLVIGKRQLIAGNRKALVFIDDEGRERYVLVRCGNPVFAAHR